MNIYIENNKTEINECMNFFKKDIASLHTGRAHPSMVDNIMVEAYGIKNSLKHIASISIPDTRTIYIQPWDKNISKNIEKSINEAKLGLNPVNEGDSIRINMPLLTQDDRKLLVKNLHHKLEQVKIKIRLWRDKMKEKIVLAERNKQISEDNKFTHLKELEDFIKKYMDDIKNIGDIKEKELSTL